MAEDWARARRGTWLTAALRAFCVAMWLIVLVAAGAAFNQISSAQASIDCKHRGYAHIDHHGGKLEDDRYHLMHHEKVSCDHDKHEGKADEEADEVVHDADHSEHDLSRAEHDLPHEHHHDKLGQHEHHHKI